MKGSMWLEAAYLDGAALSTDSGAGGNTTVNIRPPAGVRWMIAWADGYHADDHAGRDCIWYLVGAPGGTMELTRFTGLAASTVKPLYGANEDALNHWWAAPLIVTYDVYLQWYVASMTASHSAYVRYVAYKLRGTGEWGNT